MSDDQVVRDGATGEPVPEDMPDAATVLRMADEEHARLTYEMDLLEGIREGLRQIINGEGIPHDEAIARLRAEFGE
jgi:hypothetical protein